MDTVKDGCVQVVALCSWGELDRWMGCRWEELARHEAFKAGVEDGGAKGGGQERREGLRRGKSAVTRGRLGGGGGPRVVAQPRPPFHKTASQMQPPPDTNLLQRPNSTHVPASKIPRQLHTEVTS